MNKEICLATTNAGKLQEFREILAPMGYIIYSPADLAITCDPDENGTSYRENAYIKAKALAELVPFPVIADDSGLEIAGMDNGPGLQTARYAKEHGGYPNVFDSVMKAIEGKDRSAKFVCCICYLENKDAKPLYFEGICPGSILKAPAGNHGFGYDPIFHSDEANCDFGTASEEIKNRYSHRGKAIQALKIYLAI